MVKADGRSLLSTGDLRAHGRKAKLFEAFVARPPKGIDVMLMEGSTIGRPGADNGLPTESDIEAELVKQFRATRGMVLLACSAQNIDRMVSVFRACRRTGRSFVVDLYAAEMLRATGNVNIPVVGPQWPEMALFTPQSQRVRVVRRKAFDVLKGTRIDASFRTTCRRWRLVRSCCSVDSCCGTLNAPDVWIARWPSGRSGMVT